MAKERKAVERAHRALHLRGYSSVREPEPFAAVIPCTSDPDNVRRPDAEQVVKGVAARGGIQESG